MANEETRPGDARGAGGGDGPAVNDAVLRNGRIPAERRANDRGSEAGAGQDRPEPDESDSAFSGAAGGAIAGQIGGALAGGPAGAILGGVIGAATGAVAADAADRAARKSERGDPEGARAGEADAPAGDGSDGAPGNRTGTTSERLGRR